MLQRVSEGLRRSLLEQTESGMGYQIAVVDCDRYLILDAVIAVKVSPSVLAQARRTRLPISLNYAKFSSTIGGGTRPAGWTRRMSKH